MREPAAHAVQVRADRAVEDHRAHPAGEQPGVGDPRYAAVGGGGGTAMDPEVVSQLLTHRGRDEPLSTLTRREREVLALMAEGMSNLAIAARFQVTDKAIGKHTNNIFAKLGLPPSDDHNRRVMAVLAYLQATPGSMPSVGS